MRKATSVLIFFATIAGITMILRSPSEQKEGRTVPAVNLNQVTKNEMLSARIEKCEVWIGMSHAELIRSWGTPGHTNTTETASRTRDQLVYSHSAGTMSAYRCGKGVLPDRAYVYVEGGVVTAIQKR